MCPFCLDQLDAEQTSDTELVWHCGNSCFRDEPMNFYRSEDCRVGAEAIARFRAYSASQPPRS